MSGCSAHTVCSFNNYFRGLVADSLDAEDRMIGGPEVIVEIDESKLSKIKYNRGHRIEGVWVFGGIERTTEKKIFITKVAGRSADTLLTAINRYIRPGSIIFSDMWRGYSRIWDDLGLEHHTVNHSVNFVDPISGVHTNTIEATWCGLKLLIPKRNRTKDVVVPFFFGQLGNYPGRQKLAGHSTRCVTRSRMLFFRRRVNVYTVRNPVLIPFLGSLLVGVGLGS